jgi:hypothetical protein
MAMERVSPGIYRDTATGKTVYSATNPSGGQQSRPMGTRAQNQRQRGPFHKLPDKLRGQMNNERTVAEHEAGRNVTLQNPNVTTPFGSSTTTQNPDGTVSVDQTLSPEQQDIYSRGNTVTASGLGKANEFLGGIQSPFSFDASSAGRERIEDEVFKRLTRDTDQQFGRDKGELEQSLHDRGIAYSNDPNSQYQQQMGDLNKRYDTIRENARSNSVLLGGDELSRAFNISRGTRESQLGEVGALSNLGPGLMVPNFQPYQGPNYDLPSPTAVSQGNQELALRKKELNAALARMGRGGGGASQPQGDPAFSSGSYPVGGQ